MSKYRPYIFRTTPHFSPKIWGGRKLEHWGKLLPDAVAIGESWEVADLEHGQSLVANGPLAGKSLDYVVQHWGIELTGSRCKEPRFPLLIKLLDAHDNLSIQVHPGNDDVRRLSCSDASGKDECWIVLGVSDNGCVLHGFSRDVDRGTIRGAVHDGSILELLNRVDVTPGDIIHVPPGTVHAICRGVTLLEIQQPSDTTFRIYDYLRPGLDGKLRPLHLEEALEVLNMTQSSAASVVGNYHEVIRRCEPTLILNTGAYRIEAMQVVEPMHWRVDSGSVQIVFVLNGQCTLTDPVNQSLALTQGQTAVIPATTEQVAIQKAQDCSHADIIVAGLGGGDFPLLHIQ